jgi:hypothetical protein
MQRLRAVRGGARARDLVDDGFVAARASTSSPKLVGEEGFDGIRTTEYSPVPLLSFRLFCLFCLPPSLGPRLRAGAFKRGQRAFHGAPEKP